MIGQNWRKVAVIGQNCEVVQNSQGAAEFALIVAVAKRQLPGGKQGSLALALRLETGGEKQALLCSKVNKTKQRQTH